MSNLEKFNQLLPMHPLALDLQSTEITSRTHCISPTAKGVNVVQVDLPKAKPCLVPIATLSSKELRLRGSSFIRTHASKHGLPNASRKLMKEVIALLKVHYQEVHEVTMIEDDVDEPPHPCNAAAGGKAPKKKHTSPSTKNSIPYVVPHSPITTTALAYDAFKVDTSPISMSPTMLKPNNITTLLDYLPLPAEKLAEGSTDPGICSSRVLARSKGELASFGTSLLRPEAAAHKVHNSSRKPKKVVCEELWIHYVQCHPEELELELESGWIGSVNDDDD